MNPKKLRRRSMRALIIAARWREWRAFSLRYGAYFTTELIREDVIFGAIKSGAVQMFSGGARVGENVFRPDHPTID